MEVMVTECWRLNTLEDADDSHDPERAHHQLRLGMRRSMHILQAKTNAQMWEHSFALHEEYLGSPANFLASPDNAAAGGEVISPDARMAALIGAFGFRSWLLGARGRASSSPTGRP